MGGIVILLLAGFLVLSHLETWLDAFKMSVTTQTNLF